MQILNQFFGGSICKLNKHTNKNHKITIFKNNNKYIREVNSFHNWGIKKTNLSPLFNTFAKAQDNSVEGIIHKTLPIVGLMWHPERVKDKFIKDDLELISNLFHNGIK